jgi:oligopeptide/dipeptide ABC transporter ATP-binding protein
MTRPDDILLRVENLRTVFPGPGGAGELRAVDGAHLEVRRGRTLAVVGESGCGKSVMALSIMRLIDAPGRIASGRITLYPAGRESLDITALGPRDEKLYELRGGLVGMVFQEPMTALSPVHTIGNQMCEAIRLHKPVKRREAMELAGAMLARVGISAPHRRLGQYAHEMSGGMRQRVVLAMALVCGPELLIADEPTTALDVTIQAHVLGLLDRLQRELGVSVMLITHDLAVVAQAAQDVAVMYLGRVVERGPVRQVLRQAAHPYTRGLLAALPGKVARGAGRLPSIPGQVPSPLDAPPGCAFHPRCPHAQAGLCDAAVPELRELASGRQVACHLAAEVAQ